MHPPQSVTPQQPAQTPAGWYPDPNGPGQRYWDGSRWTEHTHQPQAQAAPAQPAAYVRREPGRIPPAFWGAVAACVLMFISGFGTWASALDGRVTVSGTDGDGFVVIFFAVVAGIFLAVFAAAKRDAAWPPIVAAVMGGLSAITAIIDLASLDDIMAGGVDVSGLIEAKAGWGLILALLASIGLAVMSVIVTVTRSRA